MWKTQQAAEADAEQRLNEERLRIAREVHDVVAHAMVAINVQAGVAAHLLDQDTEQAREALLHIKPTSGDALNDLRATLGVLRDPAQAAPVGPAAGLDDLDDVAAQLRAAGIEVTVDAPTIAVPTPVGAASYRIVQEALTNVLRHARATRASVVVHVDADAVSIVVADDGTGHGASGGAGRACAGCASGRRRSAGRSTPARARTAAGASRRGCRSRRWRHDPRPARRRPGPRARAGSRRCCPRNRTSTSSARPRTAPRRSTSLRPSGPTSC